MLYSKLFGKTKKDSKKYDSANATYLIKGGFIDQVMAGTYTYLSLGLRVLNKIENIIREEIDTIGAEIFMPTLAPLEQWTKTNRLETVDVLMKSTAANKFALAKNDSEYVLSPTHEETVTPLAQKFNLSYKDFPFALYHIQTKFRNEPRVKSGLLRGREFRMKDLYSFHTTVEDMKKYYENSKKVYTKIFERLGIGKETVISLASGGSFTEDYSHEFQTICETGEDVLFYVKSADVYYNREVAPSMAPVIKSEEKSLPRIDVKGEGIIGVNELAKFLNIPVEKTTKTMIYEADGKRIVAVAVRGGYNINEHKLRKVLKCKVLKLATPEIVKKITGAEVGYAGILNLPNEVEIIMDESINNRVNIEMGANKTGFHSTNINLGRDIPMPKEFYDIKLARDGDFYPDTKEKYLVKKAAEVGNIFPLYTKFTDAFDYKFIDQDGKQKPIYMGCYGIGPSRIMGVIVEKLHDEKGIIWPESVAPFQVHLIGLDLNNEEISSKVHKVYKVLESNNIEVLFDDRVETNAGEKFSDADLIGIPIRLVISKRTGEKVEYKKRNGKEVKIHSVEEVLKLLISN
ncbi:MAG: proline--tRNA ligase [Patescibacteria group bacterium]